MKDLINVENYSYIIVGRSFIKKCLASQTQSVFWILSWISCAVSCSWGESTKIEEK